MAKKARPHHHGFTLIELLIALSVFAIIATLTSSSLYYAYNLRTRVNQETEGLLKLQIALALIQKDSEQAIARAVRGNEMQLFSPFIGQKEYVEFTRAGFPNPKNIEKRSTMQRVAWICRNKQLIRRRWITLDVVSRKDFEEKVLLNNIKKCRFNYLNMHLQVLPEWVGNKNEWMPAALQLNLDLDPQGPGSFLFPIPVGLYAKI